MSSRRRRSKGTQGDAFNQEAGNLSDFADMLYSGGTVDEELRRLDTRQSRIKALALERIRPDPAQARRVMPTDLRARWLQAPDEIAVILNQWLDRANEEAQSRGRETIHVEEALKRDEDDMGTLPDDEDAPAGGPIESSFRAMLQLAASIHLHGLANPVTVVAQDEGTYQLETGERRLLAYSLLDSSPPGFVEGEWGAIPARIVEERDIWRQAAENCARQDLNAISMARQLALLLMDIYADQYTFARYDDMPGVEWYAQVFDSKRFPVPYGRGAELAAAMGLKSASQVRQYRQLLGLPSPVWDLADELDWTEYKLREMMKRARSVTTVTDSVDSDSNTGETVTTVTDFDTTLQMLAEHEAGLRDALPTEVDTTLNAGQPRKRRKRRAKRATIARSVQVAVAAIDPEQRTLTLHLDDADILADLVGGEDLILTLERRNSD